MGNYVKLCNMEQEIGCIMKDVNDRMIYTLQILQDPISIVVTLPSGTSYDDLEEILSRIFLSEFMEDDDEMTNNQYVAPSGRLYTQICVILRQ